MAKPVEVNDADFEQVVIKATTPVLVDFWAPWCGPCRMMAPILDELSILMDGKLKVVKVDTEEGENQALAMKYNIQSIPNMKLFKNGKVVKEFIGLRPKEMIRQELEKEL